MAAIRIEGVSGKMFEDLLKMEMSKSLFFLKKKT